MTRTRWVELGLVAAILLVAAFLRVYRLDQLPPGLHYDEAFDAVEAQRVLAGTERPIFFSGNMAEEPMHMYLAAVSFGLLGVSPWALRLVSAIAGIVTVAALYVLGREMFRRLLDRGEPVDAAAGRTSASRSEEVYAAALAAFILAILYWHLNFSRLGMEPVLLPLMLTLSLVFLWRGFRTGRILDFALAGLFGAGTEYTYKSALFVPGVFVLVIGVELVVQRGFWSKYLRGLVVLAVVSVLVFSPLGLYFATHPGEFVERPNEVMVTSSGPQALLNNVAQVAGMFFVHGDKNPRSNLPGRPVLDPFLAIGFVAGLGACVLRIRRAEARFMLIWLGVMALPSVLTDFAPHFGRTIGLPPVVALITAFGFVSLWHWVHVPRPVLALVLVLGLAASAYSTFHDYFDTWGTRTGLFDSFDVGLLALARDVRDLPAKELVYISPESAEHYTLRFGLNGRDVQSFDGRHVTVLPPAGQEASYAIITREDPSSAARLAKLFPMGSIVNTLFDFTGHPYALLFQAAGPAQVAPEKLVHARLGDTIELIGYDVAQENGPAGRTIDVRLYWGSIAESRADYTVFVHLLGPQNPATNSPVWAQMDGQPGQGSYPTSRWQAGEVVIDEYQLAVPADAPRGEYQIEAGMYTLGTGARVPVFDAQGAPVESNRVLFEGIAIP
ncbi:MAG: glycosyltransferase family 39 protein [Chloroflexi bacterium]|nr:glycosyltransferase family 39 protein [Chloroflexota bacterium]